MTYLTVPLNATFNKKGFSCGKSLLDDYIHKQASQDMKRRLCVVFVLADVTEIKGYYTLSNNSIPAEYVPEEVARKFPAGYKNLPVTLLGRLAVDKKFAGQGFGELLLLKR